MTLIFLAKRAVVIGRSNIVGKTDGATDVDGGCYCYDRAFKTKQLPELAKEADILVVAIGRGHFVTKRVY